MGPPATKVSTMFRPILLVVALTFLSCTSTAPRATSDRAAIDQTLDAWHDAAARADEEAYFSYMAPASVFLGTDATERWTRDQFRAYAHPYFEKGRAWTFHPRNRVVDFSADGRIAWFDELLDSASYGEMRGSGIVEKIGGEWKIQQYNLSIPIPNAIADEVVKRIRDAK